MLVALITVIGTGLRAYRLGYQSLWHDEILTYLSSNGSLSHVLFQTEVQTNVLPLYYLVTHALLYWSDLEISLRLPSFIFGSLTLPLFYAIVRHTFGAQTGVWATGLLAISPFHIFYSQEARPYAMYVFLCVLALFLLQRCIDHQQSRLLKVSFVIVAVLTFLCHAAAIPFLAFLVLSILILRPLNEWRDWVPTFLAVGLLLLPAVYWTYAIQVSGKIDQQFDPSSFLNLLWLFSTGYSLGPDFRSLFNLEKLRYLAPHFTYMIPILTLTVGLAWFGVKEIWTYDKRQCLVWVLFFFLPIIGMSVAALVTYRPFYERYVITSMLPFLVFLAVGIQHVQNRFVRLCCVGVLLVVSGFSIQHYYFDPHYYREDNRGAARFLKDHVIQGDVVICMTPHTTANLFHYLPAPRRMAIRPFRTKETVLTSKKLPVELREIIAGRKRFWVFYSQSMNGRSKGPLEQHFDEHYVTRLEFYSSKIKLILYEVPHDGPSKVL
ncbi:glycosyltransferase family 39 protein [Nitrospira sp. M1]